MIYCEFGKSLKPFSFKQGPIAILLEQSIAHLNPVFANGLGMGQDAKLEGEDESKINV